MIKGSIGNDKVDGLVPCGGELGWLTPTALTVSASPDYTSGDAIGAHATPGVLEFTSAVRESTLSGELRSLVLRDVANQKFAIDLLLFNANPSASTFTDNAAAAIHANDLSKLIGIVNVAAADWTTVGSHAVCQKELSRPILLAATTLYAALVARGAFDFAAATDLTIALAVLRD